MYGPILPFSDASVRRHTDVAVTPEGATQPLKDLFYRCKYQELIRRVDAALELPSIHVKYQNEISLLKANALYELHQVEAAIRLLKDMPVQKAFEFDEGYLYGVARLSYFSEDLDAAKQIFVTILQKTQSSQHRFKSLLGIANILYSQKKSDALAEVVERLQNFEPIKEHDERISLLIFLGNYFLSVRTDIAKAKSYFLKALKEASRQGWTYFINRSLYGLASVAKLSGSAKELEWNLTLLHTFVDETESKYFSFLVNKRFKSSEQTIRTHVEFDPQNKRIFIQDRWVAFHEKPILYQFLELLHTRDRFVSKEEIARQLWPDQDYKSRVHDPRIFDIAKRVRSMIESYHDQPIILLSSRIGYKLAST